MNRHWHFIALVFLLFIISCSPRPHVEWEIYSQEKMEQAAATGRPVVIYFYAAWCIPCHYLKDKTFTDPRVIEALNPYLRLKADMSFRESAKTQALSDQYGVSGLPALLFFDEKGQELENRRFYGFIDAETFLRSFPSPLSDKSQSSELPLI